MTRDPIPSASYWPAASSAASRVAALIHAAHAMVTCSFCGLSSHEVPLVRGEKARICIACARTALDILAEPECITRQHSGVVVCGVSP